MIRRRCRPMGAMRFLVATLATFSLAVTVACGSDDSGGAGSPAPTDPGVPGTEGATSPADPPSVDEFEPISVGVTINILGDVVERTLGDLAEVQVLMEVGTDPHTFEPSAAQIARLSEVDAIIANGLNLEEVMMPIVRSAENDGIPVLETAPLLDPIGFGETVAGEDPLMLDGHVFTDARRYSRVPALVVEFLVDELDLADEVVAELRQRAETVTAELLELDTEIEQILSVIPDDRRALVTNHHVFNYFADRYDFRVVGVVVPGGATLASPSAADLADLVGAIDEAGVSTLFADASSPTRLIDVLASETGREVAVVSLWTETLGPPGSGAETYEELMRTNATTIAAHLAE